jgi:HEAT repeat protein
MDVVSNQIMLVLCLLAIVGGSGTPSQTRADEARRLVAELREIPTPITPRARSDGRFMPHEVRRSVVYGQLRTLGREAFPAFAEALRSPDFRLRRGAALALSVLSERWWDRNARPVDLLPLLPDLVAALADEDATVVAWTAAAIGHIDALAVAAIEPLIALLSHPNEGPRNSACLALRDIGPMARDALPALRKALRDPSKDVRGFAHQAIDAIEGRRARAGAVSGVRWRRR